MSTRVGRGHALVGALLLLAQLGGGGTSFNSAVDQIERSVTRPVPQAPAARHVPRARPLGPPTLERPVLRAALHGLQLPERGLRDGAGRRASFARHAHRTL